MKQPISKHCSGSKKFSAAIVGTGCVMIVFGTTLIGVMLSPADKAQTLAAVANMTVIFLGAITGSLVTGQSFVDWRHGSQTQFSAIEQTQRIESNQELAPRIFASKHYDDGTI